MAVAATAGLAGLAAPAAAASTTPLQASLYLTPSAGSPGVGDELDVQVRLNSGSQSVGGVEAILTYPTSKLSVLGFDTSMTSWPLQGQVARNGVIKVVGASLTPVSGDANVTTVRFQVIRTGTAQVCPSDQSQLSDPLGSQLIPLTTSGATFVAGSPSFAAGCIVPDFIAQRVRHIITIKGHGFKSSGASVRVSGTGVTTSGTAVVAGTRLTTTIKVSATASTTVRNVTVTSGGKTYVCRSCLAIGPGPQVSSVTPAPVGRGTRGQMIALHGQNLDRRTIVKITGLTVTATTWVNYQQVDVTVNVPASATKGYKKISVYDPNSPNFGYYGRGSCSTCLVVGAATATPGPLYWTRCCTPGTINNANLDGTKVTTIVTGLSEPLGAAVDSSHIYWADSGNGTIMQANLEGTGVTTLVTGQNSPAGVAVDSSHIYWANTGSGTIMKANLDGTGVTTLVTGQTSPYGVAVDGSHIYWTNTGNSGTINEANLNGAGVTTLVTGQSQPTGMAVDSSHLYWADHGGTIMAANLDGTGVVTLVTGQNSPDGMAVSSSHLYWTNDNGTIIAANLDGTGVTTLVSGQNEPVGVAVGQH